MVNPPDDPKAIKIIIDNLQEDYKAHLRFLSLNNLRSLYEVGINIEDYLMKMDTSSSNNHNNSGWKVKKNDTSSSSKPTHTNHINSYNISDVLALHQRPNKEFCKRREYTPIGMNYDAAYDRLHAQGLITPIGPIREPELEKRSPSWSPSAFCKYHQGRGHKPKVIGHLKIIFKSLLWATNFLSH